MVDSPVSLWRDLRPDFPAEAIHLFGPGTDSGTFDFFNTVVLGRPGGSRVDYYPTEDDFLVVQGVAGEPWSLGYFGRAYYAANRDRVKALQVDTGFGCVSPSPESISDGRYGPLTRDLHLYVRVDALGRPAVQDFMAFALAESRALASSVGYVPLPQGEYVRGQDRLNRLVDAG